MQEQIPAPHLLTTTAPLVTKINHHYSAWFDVFHGVLLPLTIRPGHPCPGISGMGMLELRHGEVFGVKPITKKIAQDDANQTPDLTQVPGTNQTSRFESWTFLCSGTERRYPDTNDIFHSTHYSRRPRNFEQVPKARTNAECRICKLLETSGNHEGALYVDHYGNFPTHCPNGPRWTSMRRRRLPWKQNTMLRLKDIRQD